MKTLALALFFAAHLSASTVFTLNPFDNQTSGPAGGVAGFGFNLVNDSGYLVADQVAFISDGPPLKFTDFLSPQFQVVGGTNDVWTQAFDPIGQTGAGAFTIPAAAQAADVFQGELRFYYDLFSVSPTDPAFDPDADRISSGNFIPFEVKIGVQPQAAPEPASGWAVAMAMAAGLWLYRRRALARQIVATSASLPNTLIP